MFVPASYPGTYLRQLKEEIETIPAFRLIPAKLVGPLLGPLVHFFEYVILGWHRCQNLLAMPTVFIFNSLAQEALFAYPSVFRLFRLMAA